MKGAIEVEQARLDREEVRKWLINFQHEEVMRRYAHVEHGEHLRDLFEKYMYPDFDHRAEYVARNEMFRWVSNVFKSGKMERLMGAASVFLGRHLEAIKGEKDLPKYLEAVIETYDIACRSDECMTDALLDIAHSDSDLNAENYRLVYKKCSKYEEREIQIRNLVAAGDYAKAIVERGGFLDFVIETMPRIPLLSRNRAVFAFNETVTMIKAAYRAFKKSKPHLDELSDTIQAIEFGYLNDLMKSGE